MKIGQTYYKMGSSASPVSRFRLDNNADHFYLLTIEYDEDYVGLYIQAEGKYAYIKSIDISTLKYWKKSNLNFLKIMKDHRGHRPDNFRRIIKTIFELY